ncbi:uncharacterized protein N0V89_009021 [Didymosphaeria variabile]|uniref:Uncharacterized protein n=1 Tax=Didymosphaeria variabile TaxID=1932322 RepID=A0A9W8XH17_9PLEO|nr:uncharacterized protein N0V89_009021 [Didymosphaeria variabile]KAJ4350400.1 hypothetical protein N0V89_009021 [Didymosphaeria variabile]
MASKELTTFSDCRSPHTFADLRSEAHAQQRVRKHLKRYNNFRSLSPVDLPTHPQQQSHYLPSCASRTCPLYKSTYGTCDHRFQAVFPADLSSAPVSKFTPHEAYLEAQRSIPVHNRHSRKQRCNRNKCTWAKALGRKADAHLTFLQYTREIVRVWGRLDVQQDDEWVEDITHREWEGGNWSEFCMQQGATWDDVCGWESWKELGETFSKWGQRRINEMRQVKEDRLRAKLASTSTAQSPSTEGRVDDCQDLASTTGEHKTALKTTLPTTPSDIRGHERLAGVVRPRSRRKSDKIPHIIHDYGFFDEYEWYWHRNLNGCFELTSWASHSTFYSPCYCEAYALCGRWSPEDRSQPYILDEFIVSSCEDEAEDERQREEVNGLYEDVADMHAEVTDMQDVVDSAHEETMRVRKELHIEGLGSDQETEDVYDRMVEVCGEMHRLQRGLKDVLDGYKAMCDGVKVCNAVEKDGNEDGEVGEHTADDIEEDNWDIVSLDSMISSLSTSSSWSMVEIEEQT